MSQTTVENGILETIKKHEDFNFDNCKLYDRRPIGKGLARIVVISYNSHSKEQITIKAERVNWVYNVDVLVPWRGELAELDERIAVETQKVIDILGNYPRLNGTSGVQRADLVTGRAADYMTERKGVYRGKRHVLNILEIVNPGRLE
ncbi:MAG: hypothetical protein WC329_01650 [Candidatus Omnitrophota bacterium]|jgi:hypothetical protein